MATEYRLVTLSTTHIGPFVTSKYEFASGIFYKDRTEAIADGLELFGDDEFHLATLDGDTLVAFAWWENDWVDGDADLESIAGQLGLEAPAQLRSTK